MKRIFIAAMLVCISVAEVNAADLASICTGRDRVLGEGTVVEGIIVSDYRSANNALNPNLEWNKVDYAVSHKTAYLQTKDGSCGIRIIFSTQYLTRFKRYSLVSVDLSNCKVQVGKNPVCYTVTGVNPSKVSVKQENVIPDAKVKKLSQLTDGDLYTQVTVSGLEFLSKQGSFSNVDEECVVASPMNYTIVDKRYGAGDGWAQLLEDAEGNSIYMQVNSLCQWRRNNLGVPAGVGNVTGILVNEENPRYGRSYGKYSIRPLFREDIAIPAANATSFNVISQWTWDRNYKRGLLLRDADFVEWMTEPGVTGDAVISETGNGLLYTDSGCSYYPSLEFDTRYCSDHNGRAARVASSLCFTGRSSNWLKPGAGNSAIIVEASTKGISGKGLLFNFSFRAGEGTYASASGIPAEWTVEYSTDGVNYLPTGFSACLRPLSWEQTYDKEAGMLPPPYSAAIGFTEFSIALPASLLGQEKVFVRIIPSSIVMTCAKSDPAAEINSDKFNGENDKPVNIYLGMASIKAY